MALAVLLLLARMQPAAAGDSVPSEASGGPIHALRLGLAAHDPFSPERGSLDLRGEILLAVPDSASRSPLMPHIHLGGALNTGGRTSHLHAGVTWTLDLAPRVFIEASLGGALHDGATEQKPGHNALGCPALFRESLALGYRLDARWHAMLTLEHLSNAGLCRQNRGLTNLGAALGYRF
jgi:lipid A 3-O-deacylase